MFSIIVVPPGSGAPDGQLRLAPGEALDFGRTVADGGSGANRQLTIPHPGVSRHAGIVTASVAFWSLSNLSTGQTYVVENPEGAGEHIKVAPGRVAAPVPFEFARVVLPANGELLAFDVWAPRHDYRSSTGGFPGQTTAPAFALDRSTRYFLVLVALCRPRLCGDPYAVLPTTDQLVDQLRPVWPGVSRSALQWNIDYLAVKLRLKEPAESADRGPRCNGKKESLVSLALRFDLVRESDLDVLRGAVAR
ncbi:FHA domain-containing protein [Streptomyces sp. HNM0574]|uniref:FHA domain-containing protein n=1 Tax=Streptomyces sp. HNM0574 TaxID=2714954 RepID=UPI00146BE0F0|nr:FHA domain-containing protein [Streptomyces sp. HNM0574]NLU70455.1 FHA domain-containing protein [Streptomyces sp. HNM0574]